MPLGSRFSFASSELPTTPPKILRYGSNFWEGTAPVGHAGGMSFVRLLLAYQWNAKRTLRRPKYLWLETLAELVEAKAATGKAVAEIIRGKIEALKKASK